MKKPKVCYLWFEFLGGNTGGAVSHMEGLLSGLMQKGCKTSVISPKKFGFLKRYENTKYLDWKSKWKFLLNVNFLQYAKLKKIAEREKPDLIYQRHVAFTDAGSRLAKDLGVPFILEYNGPLTWVTKYWARNNVRRLFANILAPVSWHYEKKAIFGAQMIVVVSKPLKHILERIGVPKEKILFNSNGVDPKKFNPKISGTKIRKKHKIPKNAITVGFIGTFGRWHGAEVLATAARQIIQKRKDIYFLFMGNGHYRENAENAAGKSGQIIFFGSVSREQVPEHLAACDILVNPTMPNPDGTEFFGSPTKLFEYMAMGKAIVSSNIGQMQEILENNKDALLVTAGNRNSLKNAIIVLANNKELRKKLGANTRKKVVKEYTWTKNAERVLEAYKQLQ